ncbi:hypothetical protein [Microbacterium sp. bgisy207]|uniref:hypothetical protein n=1 Tax=Microbacterium sp. bgisy207 TaxID=3413800 RepID=UPI003EB9AF97
MTTGLSAANVFARDEPLVLESDTGRVPRYPRSTARRALLRVALGAVYAVFALGYQVAVAGDWAGTANQALSERVSGFAPGSDPIQALVLLDPPITNFLAFVIPGGAFGLAIAGSFVAGYIVQTVAQALYRRGLTLPVRSLFVGVLATSPLFAFTATTNFEAIVGLMFFGFGMIALVRFVGWANTQAGFRAGILLACASLSDSTLIFASVVAALAAVLFRQSRQGARLANAVVAVFPTVAVYASLALLGAAFVGDPWAMIGGDFAWNGERFGSVLQNVATIPGLLFLAPMVIVSVATLALGSRAMAVLPVALTLSIILAYTLELTPPGTAGTTFIAMLLFAVAAVPAIRGPVPSVLVCAAAVLLWIVGVLDALDRSAVNGWLHALAGVLA